MKVILYIFIVLFSFSSFTKTEKIKYQSKIRLKIKEPSDLALAESNNYLMVSDGGYLHLTDAMGKIIKTAKHTGFDYEGVILIDTLVYVVDETARTIDVFNYNSFEFVHSVSVPIQRPSNSGFESIAFHPQNKVFYLFTEKEPLEVFMFDEKFNQIGRRKIENINGDISAAFFYNQSLFVLSDELHTLYELDKDFKSINQWDLGLLNPEGFCINKSGELIVISDDMEMMYNFGKFKNNNNQ